MPASSSLRLSRAGSGGRGRGPRAVGPSALRFGLVEEDDSAVEMDLRPAEPEDLALPRSGAECQEDEGIELLRSAALAGVEQPSPFVFGEDANPPSGLPGAAHLGDGRGRGRAFRLATG